MRKPVVLAGAVLTGALVVLALVIALRQGATAEGGRAEAPASAARAAEPPPAAEHAAKPLATAPEPPRAAPPAASPPPAPPVAADERTGSAAVSGHVFDEMNEPVIDALVQVFAGSPFQLDERSVPLQETHTDTGGAFALAGLHGECTLLAASRKRICSTGRHGRPLDGHRYENVDLRVAPGPELQGRVVDEASAPVPGARLSFDFSLQVAGEDSFAAFTPLPEPTTSDNDGRFSFTLPANREILDASPLRAAADGYATWTGPVPTNTPLTIVLSRGRALRGVVSDETGAPVGGAEIRALSQFGRPQATSAADGSYELTGVPDDPLLEVLTHAKGHAILFEQDVALQPAGDTRHDIALEPGRALAGRVTGPDGKPVAGARVAIEGDHVRKTGKNIILPLPTWERSFGLDSALTDAEGRFRIEDLYAGSFSVTAHAPQDEETQVQLQAASGSEKLELVLPDPETTRIHLFGQLSDAMTGTPIEHATFTFLAPHEGAVWSGTPRAIDAPLGRYDFLGPTADMLQLSVSADGYAPYSGIKREWTAGPQREDVALRPLRTLVVEVVTADGKPAPGAVVQLRDESGSGQAFGTDAGLAGGARTDADGRLRMTGLPAGILSVQVQLGTHKAEGHADLAAPVEATIHLVLDDEPVRQLSISIFAGNAVVAADTDPKAVHELIKTGQVTLLDGSIVLSVTQADGQEVAHCEEFIQDGHLIGTHTDLHGEGTVQSNKPYLHAQLTVPSAALSLQITSAGRATWRYQLAAGEADVKLTAVLVGG